MIVSSSPEREWQGSAPPRTGSTAAATTPFACRASAWQPSIMARETTEPWVQLTTRVPKDLQRHVKLRCVQAETSVMDFVVAALKEKLARKGRGRRARHD